MSTLNTRIKHKRDTSSNWTSKNPVLLDGELIVVLTDSGETRFKIGDGNKRYTQLPFLDEYLRSILNDKVDAEDGKGLSTEDFTTEEKEKLAGITAGANAYTHPSYTSKSNGFYKVTVDSQGHVSGTAEVAKSDITNLGITADDTLHSVAKSGNFTELNAVPALVIFTDN